MGTISIARTDDEIAKCFRVMHQLREHLTAVGFVPTVRQMEHGGYRLAFLEDKGDVQAVAGFRVTDRLYARGKILYVDDLITDRTSRSQGHGKRLFAWLVDRAKEEGCMALELDSGVQRFDAHRFYLANRMIISSHHFRLTLE